jgi:hypothetical protein
MIAMIKDDSFPFPAHWTQVFIPWERMLEQRPNCHDLTNWVEKEYTGFGRYQLRGPEWNPTSGFLFYFEDERDALVFMLKWM